MDFKCTRKKNLKRKNKKMPSSTKATFIITLGLVLICTSATAFLFPSSSPSKTASLFRNKCTLQATAAAGSEVPTGVKVDVIFGDDTEECDFGELLKSHKKCVLFAVPGAFTPTCSVKHLPGFISKIDELKRAGVEDVYCMAVNDKFVMKAWAKDVDNCEKSGIKLVADGNCEFTKKLDLVKDCTGGRMQLRTQRFAAIIENGKFTTLNVDENGLDSSSAEVILDSLKVAA